MKIVAKQNIRFRRYLILLSCGFIIASILGLSFATQNSDSVSQPNPTAIVEIQRVTTWDVDDSLLPPSKLGIHLMLDDGRQAWDISLWETHMRAARDIVGEWGLVTQVVRSSDLDPTRWQVFFDLCAELHLIPIIRLATTFDFENNQWTAPPQDENGRYETIAAEYATFIAELEWHTEYHYIVIGNEPNHGNEWGGVPNPAEYARFLVDVASTIHDVDPNSVVMNAGLDPFAPNTGSIPFADGARFIDSRSFMDGMVAAEPDVFTHIDAWSSHAYPLGAFIQPPWEQTYTIDFIHDAVNPYTDTPPANIVNRGVNGYTWELYQLEQYGVDPLPVFITETGWRHSETIDESSLDSQPIYPTSEEVATYIHLTLFGNNGQFPDLPENGWIPWMDDPRVAGITFFALNGTPHEWGHTNWLQMSADGEILGRYAMSEVLSFKDVN